MKKSLLAFSVLSLGAALSASAEEARYYVIKDGKLADGIVQRPYAPVETEAYDTLVCGQTFDGKNVAEYRHGANYKDVRFDLSAAPLDLSKTWVMTLKYRIPFAADSTEGHNTYKALVNCSANDGTKPAFFFGLSAVADSMSLNYMDYMFNVQAAYESIENGGDWVSKELYMIAPSFLKEANSFVMGYAREAGTADIADEPAYIEELSFHAAGEFPFFAEDFSPRMSNVWSDVGKLSGDFKWKSGATFSVGKKTINSTRIWNKPWDDSQVPATEAAHAVKCSQAMAWFSIDDIAIPAGATNLAVHAMVKSDVTSDNQEVWDGLAETPAERPLTVKAIFDNGDEVAVFPTYVRKSQWEWAIGDVAVPAGATKFTLKFQSDDCAIALLVNQVLISQAAIDLAPFYGKAAGNDVADFSAAPAAEVYVDGDVVVAAENATNVEVIALNGAIVASANGNSVNISGLAEGVYVVRVASANGVAAAIIKK
ncbi:MAG: T9SS type A sorting domain-containing protein [Paludibacteraceae bacterium]|nr:T9SS type A sorting domain-containing protein [Paludibacteraceae bacterium]